jgi:DNA-directed RNA polymerase specialized sigma24 family protein
LATIVRNQALDFIKKNNRHELVELTAFLPSATPSELEKIVNHEWQRSIAEKAWEYILKGAQK